MVDVLSDFVYFYCPSCLNDLDFEEIFPWSRVNDRGRGIGWLRFRGLSCQTFFISTILYLAFGLTRDWLLPRAGGRYCLNSDMLLMIALWRLSFEWWIAINDRPIFWMCFWVHSPAASRLIPLDIHWCGLKWFLKLTILLSWSLKLCCTARATVVRKFDSYTTMI